MLEWGYYGELPHGTGYLVLEWGYFGELPSETSYLVLEWGYYGELPHGTGYLVLEWGYFGELPSEFGYLALGQLPRHLKLRGPGRPPPCACGSSAPRRCPSRGSPPRK